MEEDRRFEAAFNEVVSNGKLVAWDHWVGRMPTLSAAEASRLLSGLDPDAFRELDSPPTSNDSSRQRQQAKNIERLAVAEGRTRDTPAGWLKWAASHGFSVDVWFAAAVHALPAPSSIEAKADEPATWWDAVLPYLVAMLKVGRYATAKEMYKALEVRADSEDSPFGRGSREHRGTLLVLDFKQPMGLKTFQNRWKELRQAAASQ